MAETITSLLLGHPEQGRAVHLVDGPFVIQNGRRLDVPDGGRRLLVFVALARRTADRRQAAGSLWPEVDEARAAGNLRSALWRLRTAGIDVISGDKTSVCLRPGTTLDVDMIGEWATQVIDGTAPVTWLTRLNRRADALDLLPGWHDDWVVFERERLRQRLLHAMEVAALSLVDQRRFADAIDTAMSAVQAEPLRESAQAALITAHLAEGNSFEARRSFSRYACLLAEELGLRPGPAIRELVRSACSGSAAQSRGEATRTRT